MSYCPSNRQAHGSKAKSIKIFKNWNSHKTKTCHWLNDANWNVWSAHLLQKQAKKQREKQLRQEKKAQQELAKQQKLEKMNEDTDENEEEFEDEETDYSDDMSNIS